MEYEGHVVTDLGVAGIISIAYFMFIIFVHPLPMSPLIQYWVGVIPYTFLITCDLDSAKSKARQLWGPFKIIWEPFVRAGHREILHDPCWGPFILISFLWVPLTAKGVHVPTETILGAICPLETHILVDHEYLKYKKIKKLFHKIRNSLHV